MGDIRLLYLCDSPAFHVANDVILFKKNNYKIIVLSVDWRQHNNVEGLHDVGVINLFPLRKMLTLRKFSISFFEISMYIRKIILSNKMQIFIRKIISENDIDIIFASWSIASFPIIESLQKNPDVPIIFRFLMYPATLSKNLILLENAYAKTIIEKLDGRVIPTKIMYQYFWENFNLSCGKNIIFPEYLSECFFYKKRLQKLSDVDGEPHIVFLGSVNFKKHNNIVDIISYLIKNKIHVHIMKSKYLDIKENKYLHFFTPFSHEEIINGKLGTFLTQFDAALVAYNNNYKQVVRFSNVIPNRFLLALTGGIPIVLPKDNNLLSCEEWVMFNKIGFVYNSIDELANKLRDEDLMYELRKTAMKKSNAFHYEKHFNRLDGFIRRILDEQ